LIDKQGGEGKIFQEDFSSDLETDEESLAAAGGGAGVGLAPSFVPISGAVRAILTINSLPSADNFADASNAAF